MATRRKKKPARKAPARKAPARKRPAKKKPARKAPARKRSATRSQRRNDLIEGIGELAELVAARLEERSLLAARASKPAAKKSTRAKGATKPKAKKSKASTKLHTVKLNWKEVYYTNCPLISASNVDQELGWTKEEFKKIGVELRFSPVASARTTGTRTTSTTWTT